MNTKIIYMTLLNKIRKCKARDDKVIKAMEKMK